MLQVVAGLDHKVAKAWPTVDRRPLRNLEDLRVLDISQAISQKIFGVKVFSKDLREVHE